MPPTCPPVTSTLNKLHKNLYKKSVLLQKTEINPINCLESKSLMIYHLTDKSLDHTFDTIFFKFQFLNVLLAIFPLPHAQKVKANSILNCMVSIQSSYTLKGRLFTYSIILISECNCNLDQSMGTTCDANGICICKPGFTGNKCEEGKCKEHNQWNFRTSCRKICYL